MIAFLYYFAAMGAVLSVSLLFPVLVAFGSSENEIAYRLLIYAVLGSFFSVSTLLSIQGRMGGLERNTAIVLAVLSWTLFPLLLAIPLADTAGISYVDAVFEATSGLTTTGASIFPNLETVPRAIILYRAQLQWFGGIGTLITLVLILAPWRIGGLPLTNSASIAASIVTSPARLASYCGGLVRVYAILTLTCLISLLILGTQTFNALIFSLTAVSTGGFLPSDESPDMLLGRGAMVVFSLFLIIGATSIFWQRNLYRGRVEEIKAHRESYLVIGVWLGLSLIMGFMFFRAAGSSDVLPPLSAMIEGLFNAASLISTSGVQSRPGAYTILPITLVLLLLVIGAGCYSTAGGIKFYRLGGMLTLAFHELNRLVYPSSIRPTHFGYTKYDLEFMKAIWTLYGAFLLTITFSTWILSLSGMSFEASFAASISSLTNAGPAYIGELSELQPNPQPPYSDMISLQKLLLAVLMILGRLEIIVVIACVNLLIPFRR